MKPSKVDRAILLLTVAGGSVAKESLVNVYGVREAAAAKWDSGDPDSFRWKNSPSEAGITNQVYLGQLTVQNENEALKDQTDQVRFYSEALDDFLRSAEGTTVTLALVSETWSDQPTRFRSKDGKPDQAPALAIRRVP